MGLRINTNVIALQAQHKLQGTTRKLATSLERLSSGLRINKGSDDVVGLLKSESLRSQIRGISTAELNIANGSNLLGVAEGSLAQLTDLGQRMRELVVQAADTTISSSDRQNLTTSLADLQSEFGRLVAASEFDGVKLLNGSFSAKSFQVGPNAGDKISLTLSDTRASVIGKVAVITSVTVTTSVATAVTTALSTTLTATTLVLTDPTGININGVTITASTFSHDGISTYEGSDSAIAYVNAINSFSGQTGVTAQVVATTVTWTYGTSGINTAGSFAINGVTIDISALQQSVFDDTDATEFVTAVNAKSSLTGITASVDTATNLLQLQASDGRNIMVQVASSSTSVGAVLGNTAGSGFSISSAGSLGGAFLYRGTFKLFSDDTFTLSGATEISASTAASLVDATSLSNLDVSTAGNAEVGIFTLDNVIRQLQTRRAEVGSKTIRFGIAEAELQVRKENLTNSESRIRDADVAVETANLTSAQILQQAGASVLSRANSVPQIALSLLQG